MLEGVIRSCKSKDRQYNGKDNKGVIRSCKSKKDRQYNGKDNINRRTRQYYGTYTKGVMSSRILKDRQYNEKY